MRPLYLVLEFTMGKLWFEPRFADVPATVDKRTVADLGDWPYPRSPIAPLTEVVHDRLSVEVFRGCTRGCRFCQAGMITRPVRERPAEHLTHDAARTEDVNDFLQRHRNHFPAIESAAEALWRDADLADLV